MRIVVVPFSHWVVSLRYLVLCVYFWYTQDALANFQEEYGVAVMQKGIFVPKGETLPDPNEKKLHLVFESESEDRILRAVREMEKGMKDLMRQLAERGALVQGGRYSVL